MKKKENLIVLVGIIYLNDLNLFYGVKNNTLLFFFKKRLITLVNKKKTYSANNPANKIFKTNFSLLVKEKLKDDPPAGVDYGGPPSIIFNNNAWSLFIIIQYWNIS